MAMPRTPLKLLELQGNKSNLERAKSYAPRKKLFRRADLEQMYADIAERRKEALAEVRSRGLVLYIDKSVRGKIYLAAAITNPAMRIVQACERQLAALAKLLTDDDDTPTKKSTEEQLADMKEFLQ